MRDVLQEQRPSISDAFPTKVRLLLAARLGDMQQIKQLLARSPMLLNTKSDPGEDSNPSEQPFVAGLTALHEAAMHNHAQLVQLLCDYGANCNARTSAGLIPLQGAVLTRCHEAAVREEQAPRAEAAMAALHCTWPRLKAELRSCRSCSLTEQTLRRAMFWDALLMNGPLQRVWRNRYMLPLVERILAMSTQPIPVGAALLGRVLNSNGEPIDHKDMLADASLRPLYEPDTQRTKVEPSSMGVLETGIKVLDLLAPASHGSVIGMMAEPGLGLVVVAEELMNNLITHHQAVLVTAGMSETTYDASMLREVVRDIEAEDRTVMLFEQTGDAVSMQQRLIRAAMTIAAHFEEEGNEVILVIDRHLAIPEMLAEVRHFVAAKGVASLLFAPMDEFDQQAESSVLSGLDVEWWFSRARAAQGLWPAIDPLASRSRVLESDAVSQEHRQVAKDVRDLLQRYDQLREQEKSGMLSEEDTLLLTRAERFDLFLTQPFVIAEAYTDLPGAYLTSEETIDTFRDLLDRRYDAVPTQALNFVGRIERG
jgi:F-type H+-transporting ATPase subunit beta